MFPVGQSIAECPISEGTSLEVFFHLFRSLLPFLLNSFEFREIVNGKTAKALKIYGNLNYR